MPVLTRLSRAYLRVINTRLGRWFSEGTELSVGEWQRLALARAFLRRAQIMILDEPTSALDSWAEVDWFDRFRSLAQGKTAIVITHRLDHSQARRYHPRNGRGRYRRVGYS